MLGWKRLSLASPWKVPLFLVDGSRGAHPKEHVRLPDGDELRAFQDAASGAWIKMIMNSLRQWSHNDVVMRAFAERA